MRELSQLLRIAKQPREQQALCLQLTQLNRRASSEGQSRPLLRVFSEEEYIYLIRQLKNEPKEQLDLYSPMNEN